jgi:peroxiredoxin
VIRWRAGCCEPDYDWLDLTPVCIRNDTSPKRFSCSFGLVYEFTGELKHAYQGFNLDIAARNGTPNEWALPMAATYVIDRNGTIIYAHTDPDYRERADPREVLNVLTKKAAAA